MGKCLIIVDSAKSTISVSSTRYDLFRSIGPAFYNVMMCGRTQACELQSCLNKNIYKPENCADYVRKLYLCCQSMHKGGKTESTACPTLSVVERWLESHPERQVSIPRGFLSINNHILNYVDRTTGKEVVHLLYNCACEWNYDE